MTTSVMLTSLLLTARGCCGLRNMYDGMEFGCCASGEVALFVTGDERASSRWKYAALSDNVKYVVVYTCILEMLKAGCNFRSSLSEYR